MKSLFITFFLTLSINAFGNYTLADLAGTYEISHPSVPVTNTVTLTAAGEVFLIENSPFGTTQCNGQATIEDQVLMSEVTCQNGEQFSQSIDFTGVTLADQFQAPVYSSLYRVELIMNIKVID